MKKILIACAFLVYTIYSFADDYANAKDAEALVANVIKAISVDRMGTLKEITDKEKKWIRLDLYPMVYDMRGICLAHGQNAKLVGKDLSDMEDADGKEFVKERVALAASNKGFWQDYKFTDPVTKKVLPKTAYCERIHDDIVCAGIYKR